MATQIGTSRVYTDTQEIGSNNQVECTKCRVKAVPRGINSTTKKAAGEKHCPNCGHVHGRANH